MRTREALQTVVSVGVFFFYTCEAIDGFNLKPSGYFTYHQI